MVFWPIRSDQLFCQWLDNKSELTCLCKSSLWKWFQVHIQSLRLNNSLVDRDLLCVFSLILWQCVSYMSRRGPLILSVLHLQQVFPLISEPLEDERERCFDPGHRGQSKTESECVSHASRLWWLATEEFKYGDHGRVPSAPEAGKKMYWPSLTV